MLRWLRLFEAIEVHMPSFTRWDSFVRGMCKPNMFFCRSDESLNRTENMAEIQRGLSRIYLIFSQKSFLKIR